MEKDIIDLLLKARTAGVGFFFEQDRLRIKVPVSLNGVGTLLSDLKIHKDQISSFLKAELARTGTDSTRIPRIDHQWMSVPASFSQERLWLTDQLGGSVQYHIPMVAEISNDLNVEALQKAFGTVIIRHEVLRTVLRIENDAVVQIPFQGQAFTLKVNDQDMNEERLLVHLQSEILRPFDLSSDLMIRAELIRRSTGGMILFIVMHHIVADGWSMSLFVNEVMEVYDSIIENRTAELKPLEIQYADYAIWQRKHLSGETLKNKLDFWRSKLDGISPLYLPADFRRPLQQDFHGNTLSFELAPGLTEKVNLLAERSGATPFMVLIAVFKILLFKYTGQHDLCIGTSTANRDHAELEPLIGFFVNSVVIRSNVDSTITFQQFLEDLKSTVLEAYQHQDVPFEKIVEIVEGTRDVSRTPVFQVQFSVNTNRNSDLSALKHLQLNIIPFQRNTSQFDLTFNIEIDQSYKVIIEYRTSLFSEVRIKRMFGHYQQLIKSITGNPALAIDSLELLTQAEYDQIMLHFNRPWGDRRENSNVIKLFEKACYDHRGSTAICSENRTWTFGELNNEANKLARYLTSCGAAPGGVIPVLASRRGEMIVAIIAILKSGNAFVPIDPEWPKSRVSAIFNDLGNPPLVVDPGAAVTDILDDFKGAIVNIDDKSLEISLRDDKNIEIAMSDSDLAYVLFTSGSTGTPKGVMVDHGNLNNYLQSVADYISPGYRAGSFIHLPFTFDASITAVFLPLVHGKRIVVSKHKGAEVFNDPLFLIHAQYDFIKLTPAHLPLLANIFEENPAIAHTLVVGGEALLQSHLKGIDRKSGVRIVNEYGPTEATVGCVVYELTAAQIDDHDNEIPIGTPLANTDIFILDKDRRLVPIGVPGELCIGGHSVARGYLNDPNLTAQKFACRTIGQKTVKLYHTGDISRWREDGVIEYLGRSDDQVKIRGYRIELSEITRALSSIPFVSDHVVMTYGERTTDMRLVAFVVVKDESSDTARIEDHLKSALPAYMVPSINVVPQIPINNNGKVDREKLISRLNRKGRQQKDGSIPLAKPLIGIWASILNISPDLITPDSDFFSLGGHSLLGINILSAVNKTLGLEAGLSDLFENPTIRAFAKLLESKGGKHADKITKVNATVSQLSFSQEQLWLVDRLKGSRNYHVPMVGELTGAVNIEVLEQSLCEIVDRHEILRTIINEREGDLRQIVMPSGDWRPRRLDLNEYQAGNFIAMEVMRPFDLSSEYPIRVSIVSCSPTKVVVVIVVHHIAFDAWSQAIFIRELTSLYRSATNRVHSSLEPLPIQYSDFALWQRNHLDPAAIEASLNYWNRKLTDLSPVVLNADYPRPISLGDLGKTEMFRMPTELVSEIRQFSRKNNVSFYVTTLAAFYVLLYRYTGQNDLVVGSPLSGRSNPLIDPLIGYFVNTVCLRINLENGTEPIDFIAVLENVKATVSDATAHQFVPFEKVVQAVARDSGHRRGPLFQVMFAHQKFSLHHEFGDELMWRELPSGYDVSKFDLTFILDEHEHDVDLHIEYNIELFRPDSISRMSSHYLELLQAVISQPHSDINKIEMLSEAERDAVDRNLITSLAGFSKKDTVIDCFERHARIAPGTIALMFENATCTYRELDEQSNKLARYLIRNGAQHGDLIGICFAPSIELIVGILAIVKAGCAYLPIDPQYPQQRIEYMLLDSNVSVLITDTAIKRTSFQTYDLKIIDTKECIDAIEKESVERSAITISQDDLMYVIYTSGSSGQPKGTIIDHRNVFRLFVTDRPLFDFSNADVWTLFHSVCFDFSVWEIFGALVFGGRLVIVPRDVARDPRTFCNLIADRGVTVLNQTPGAFYILQDHFLELNVHSCLRYVIFGGEALNPVRLKSWKSRLPGCKLINMYGITETTVHVTFKELSDSDLDSSVSVIGKEISTLITYVLSPATMIQPAGVPGELYVGGAGVARGYLNRPELTSERFIQNPFGNVNDKLYRTGDVVVRRSTGELEYLGRSDRQVKIRGFRIELAEIESALLSHPSVSNCTVTVDKQTAGTERLVAYVVPVGVISRTELISHVGSMLPHYMVPSFIVELTSLPFTHNGKIDTAALRRIPIATTTDLNEPVALTAVQAQLVGIWKEVLGVSDVGINDDFFDLGGDSILLIRLLAKQKSALSKEISVSDFYHGPTIQSVARILDVSGVTNVAANEKEIEDGYFENLLNNYRSRIKEQEVELVLPMTDIQQGMVFTSLYNPDDSIYHEQFTFVIPDVDPEIFRHALEQIVEKHQALRTRFDIDLAGDNFQVILERIHFDIGQEDISSLSTEEQQNYIGEWMKRERTRAFNLNRAPLWRTNLFRIAATRLAYVIQFHHSILDGWSLASMNTELMNTIEALKADPGYRVRPLAIDQRRLTLLRMQQNGNDDRLQFWRKELEDYVRLDIFDQSPVQQECKLDVDDGTVARLKEFCATSGVSLRSVTLSALLVVLKQLTASDDLLIGIVGHSRPGVDDADKMLGCFLNTKPFRITPFAPLRKTWNTVTSLVDEKLKQLQVEDETSLLAIARNVGRESGTSNPFFDVLFNYVDFHVYDQLGTLPSDLEQIEFPHHERTNTILDVSVNVTGGEMLITSNLRRRLRSGVNLDTLMEWLNNTLRSISIASKAIDLATIIGAHAKSRLDQLAGNPGVFRTPETTLVDLFRQQVKISPTAEAIKFNGYSITYRDLDATSDLVALRLRDYRITQGAIVPICASKSPEFVIVMLGILKSGCAYVPIDPRLPARRLDVILDDIAPQFVITDRDMTLSPGVTLLKLKDLLREEVSRIDDHLIKRLAEPVGSSLAYIIFTSGSTGRPKGVMVNHRSVVNLVKTQSNEFGIRTDDRICLFSNFHFDASVEQVFLALLNGAALVIPSSGILEDTQEIQRFIVAEKITHFHATPGYLINVHFDPAMKDLRRVIAGAEICSGALAAEWASHCNFYNEYGPTETTVTAIEHKCEPGPYEDSVPIGRPIGNTRALILDRNREQLPQGVTGYLYIGGEGVARGYLNRPELTHERFVVDPFSDNGSLLYDTGDLARLLPDGTIAYLGREDDQVKIRGYRVELTEISTLLEQHPAVKQCVVVCRDASSGSRQIVAYIAFKEDGSTDVLSEYLSERLPEYMIPSVWRNVAQFALNSNGKIDRTKLDEVSEQKTSSAAEPRDSIESDLADIWKSLLRKDSVGIFDNYFEMGGDSIIALQLASRARQRGYMLTPREVFENQTIAELARAAKMNNNYSGKGEQGQLTGEAPLLPIQRMFFEGVITTPSFFNQSVLLGIDRTVKAQDIQQAIDVLVKRHDALRFKYVKEENHWKQYYGDAIIELIVVDQQSKEMGSLAEQCNRWQRTLDIEKGILVRAVLIRTPPSEERNRLLIIVHHLAIDGVSWRILLEQLENLLASRENFLSHGLLPKGTSYRQWASFLTDLAQTEEIVSELPYWENIIRSQSDLPVQGDKNAVVYNRDMAAFSGALNKKDTDLLLHHIHHAYHSEINDVLLTAFARSVSSFTKQNKVVIGLESHGRHNLHDHVHLEEAVGWFTTLHPVSVNIDGNSGIGYQLRYIKEQLRSVPGNGIGFGLLKYLNADSAIRDRLAGSRINIVFNYLGQVDNALHKGSVLQTINADTGDHASPDYAQPSRLVCNCWVAEERFEFELSYPAAMFDHHTVATIADVFKSSLIDIIKHCRGRQPVKTPSDFGLPATVSCEDLDWFVGEQLGSLYEPGNIETISPLSPMQEGMLFHTLLGDSHRTYVQQYVLDLHGTLDVELLKKSWQMLIARHSILRTAFFCHELNIPVQCVLKHCELPLEEISLQMDPASVEFKEALDLILRDDLARQFDISQACLMRVKLVRCRDSIKLVWTFHHVIIDGWSTPILFRELMQNYDSLLNSAAITAGRIDAYQDFIRFLSARNRHGEQKFWRQYLQNFGPAVPLPFMERYGGGSDRRKSVSLNFDADTTRQIRSFAKQVRVTMNTVLQAAWAYLLCRYTNKTDVVFGVAVSGRPHTMSDADNRVGLYINTLPLRVRLNMSAPCAHVLSDLQANHSSTREFQFTSLAEIQKLVDHHARLFDVLMVFENYPIEEFRTAAKNFTGVDVANVSIDDWTSYPLTILASIESEFSIRLCYDPSLIAANAVDMMIRHLEHIILQLASGTISSLNELAFLDETDKALLERLGHSRFSLEEGSWVGRLFENGVKKHHDKLAVVCGDDTITYEQLSRRCNAIAHYLRSKGAGNGDRVGVLIHRSIESVVAMIGVMKAGCVYVPIDPGYPPARVEFIVEDSGIEMILGRASDGLLPTVKTFIDIDSLRYSEFPDESPQVKIKLDDPSYVIYTSGSTGKPKGVIQTHRMLHNLIVWDINGSGLLKGQRHLQYSSFSFDSSLHDVFYALSTGATLHVITDDARLDMVLFAAFIVRNKISTLSIPYSPLKYLFDSCAIEEFDGHSITEIISTGEQLYISGGLRAFLEANPHIRIHNFYGPSETHVVTAASYCFSTDAFVPTHASIGRPLYNTSLYVLDNDLQLCAPGCTGELFVGGYNLAVGYQNDPAGTHSRFVKNPFDNGGSLLYKTGDRCRWNSNQHLEYLGRIDDQVKVRGYRIEPAEIEYTIQQFNGVKNCVVTVTRDSTAGILAYIICDDDFNISELQSYVRSRLPVYMVPSGYLIMETFPMTSNGKVDKQALPKHIPGSNRPFEEAATPTEIKLASIWSKILGLQEAPGVTISFFELGGHSLLATRLISMIRKEFEVSVPIKVVFELDTIRDLGQYMDLYLDNEVEEDIDSPTFKL